MTLPPDDPHSNSVYDTSRRLWSLLDMLKISAVRYVKLGRRTLDANFIFELDQFRRNDLYTKFLEIGRAHV